MSGEGRCTIHRETGSGGWPNGLTVDYMERRIVWIDARYHLPQGFHCTACTHTHTVHLFFFMAAYIFFSYATSFSGGNCNLDNLHDKFETPKSIFPVFEHSLARQQVSVSDNTNFVLNLKKHLIV